MSFNKIELTEYGQAETLVCCITNSKYLVLRQLNDIFHKPDPPLRSWAPGVGKQRPCPFSRQSRQSFLSRSRRVLIERYVADRDSKESCPEEEGPEIPKESVVVSAVDKSWEIMYL